MKNFKKYLKEKNIGLGDDYDDHDMAEDESIENLQNTVESNDHLIAYYKGKLQPFMQGKIQSLIAEISELDSESAKQLDVEFQALGSNTSLDQYEESSKFIENCSQRLKSLLISKVMEQQKTIEAQESEMSLYGQKEHGINE